MPKGYSEIGWQLVRQGLQELQEWVNCWLQTAHPRTMNHARDGNPPTEKGHRKSMALAGDHEEFVITENESCSQIVRPDWSTRENDILCSMPAAVVCTNSGCEALLCTLHEHRCDECQRVFCEGCYADHEEQVHSKKPSGREAHPSEKIRHAG